MSFFVFFEILVFGEFMCVEFVILYFEINLLFIYMIYYYMIVGNEFFVCVGIVVVIVFDW